MDHYSRVFFRVEARVEVHVDADVDVHENAKGVILDLRRCVRVENKEGP